MHIYVLHFCFACNTSCHCRFSSQPSLFVIHLSTHWPSHLFPLSLIVYLILYLDLSSFFCFAWHSFGTAKCLFFYTNWLPYPLHIVLPLPFLSHACSHHLTILSLAIMPKYDQKKERHLKYLNTNITKRTNSVIWQIKIFILSFSFQRMAEERHYLEELPVH